MARFVTVRIFLGPLPPNIIVCRMMQPIILDMTIVQETVLRPHCYLLWADIKIPWTEFLECYRCYLISSHWKIPITLSPLHYTVATTLEVLHYIRRQELTGSKDRIYASMALKTSDEAMPALQPDYSKNSSHSSKCVWRLRRQVPGEELGPCPSDFRRASGRHPG